MISSDDHVYLSISQLSSYRISIVQFASFSPSGQTSGQQVARVNMENRPVDAYSSGTKDYKFCPELIWKLATKLLGNLQVPPTPSFHIDDPVLNAYHRATKDYGFCPNRVWTLSKNLSDKLESLPTIFPAEDTLCKAFAPATGQDQSETATHQWCTIDLCEESQKDATKVPQRHESPQCQRIPCSATKGLFPSNILEAAAVSQDQLTAWHLYGRRTVAAYDDFMAISHVWSDGTGTGMLDGGVNTCLFSFFRNLARQLGCTGIWWDTICLPAEKNARSVAMKSMHLNYARAKVTVVHDCSLRSLEWVDAETACLALVLSPWFSRGWTALELARSNKVKIIFKDRDDFVLKDLDDDLLANAHTARHRLLSALIDDFRKRIIDVNQLLKALQPRYTSWPRDKPNIAALLVDVPEAMPFQDVTQDKDMSLKQRMYIDVAKHLGIIAHGNLFHNFSTILGGTSWCPSDFLSLPLSSSAASLRIDEFGNVVGQWSILELESVFSETGVNSERADGLFQREINARFKHPRIHRILVEPGRNSQEGGLLVEILGKDSTTTFCQFIGHFRFAQPISLSMSNDVTKDVTILNRPQQRRTWKSDLNHLRSFHSPGWSLEDTGRERCSPKIFRQVTKMTDKRKPCQPIRTEAERDLLVQDASMEVTFLHAVQGGDVQKVASLLECFVLEERSARGLGKTSLDRYAPWARSNDDELLFSFRSQYDFRDQSGRTPLAHAARNGHEEIIQLLLSWHEVQIDLPDDYGTTPLMWAIRQNHHGAARLLIGHGADIERSDLSKTTPLMHAITWNSTEMLRLLQVNKAQLDHRGRDGLSPLHHAVGCLHKEAVQMLLEWGVYVDVRDENDNTPLYYAVKTGNIAISRLLLDNEANPDLARNSYEESPLVVAIKLGHEAMVRLLLEYGADCSYCDNNMRNALSFAAEMGSETLVDLLLVKGHRVDVSTELVTRSLSYATTEAVAKRLVRGGAEVNHRDGAGSTPLHGAARRGYAKVVRVYIEYGADANARDYSGRTALSLAAERGYDKVVQFLLDHRATANVKDESGLTALSWAAKFGRTKVVEILLDHRAAFGTKKNWKRKARAKAIKRGCNKILLDRILATDAKDYEDNTALSQAAQLGHDKVVQVLIDHNATIDAKDDSNQTALIKAARHGHVKVVQILLDHGAAIDTIDQSGRTALRSASTNDIRRLLLEWGARRENENGVWVPLETILAEDKQEEEEKAEEEKWGGMDASMVAMFSSHP